MSERTAATNPAATTAEGEHGACACSPFTNKPDASKGTPLCGPCRQPRPRSTLRGSHRSGDGRCALAEDELCRRGHAPSEAARLARVAAGGRTQALEALREQRGLVPSRLGADGVVRNTGPEGVVFGRLAPGATLERAHAEVSALGILRSDLGLARRDGGSIDAKPRPEVIGPRVVAYTFAFIGDLEPGEMGLLWSLSSLGLVLLLLPLCANIAILNYARIVTRQQEFAARHAPGGSRARIVWQSFIEALVLTAAAAGVALAGLRVVAVVMTSRLHNIPGGPPF